MNKLIGQLILIGISGPTLTADEKEFIIENNICGVVLFPRNCVDAKQIHKLCSDIQSLRFKMKDKAPFFIGIDMEGGRIHTLKPPFTQWPSLRAVGDLDNATVSFDFTNKMGLELAAAGINLDFAPCIDVFSNPANTVIGDRALSTDPAQVEKHTSALIRGYIKANIINCVKHFPGHGHTLIDSHDDIPIETCDLNYLMSHDLLPFKKAFRSKADTTMTAHVHFKNIDPQWPVTLSEIFLKKICREELKFKGLIIADDLDMKALSKHFDRETIAVRALQAGNDLLMYCHDFTSPTVAIDAITNAVAQGLLAKGLLEELNRKVLDFKKARLSQMEPMSWSEAEQIIGCKEHQQFADDIRAGIVRPVQPAG